MKMFCPKSKDCVVICVIHKQEHTKVLSCDKLGYDGCPACVPVPSKPKYHIESDQPGESHLVIDEIAKPKEELIKGLAEWLKNNRYGYPSPTWKDIAGCLFVYLSSHGFGNIEQAKREELARCTIEAREERERIIKYLLDSNIISTDGEYFKALKQEGK